MVTRQASLNGGVRRKYFKRRKNILLDHNAVAFAGACGMTAVV